MGNEYKYDAFISYRHVSPDKEIAARLQKKLESYKPPKALRGSKKRGGMRIFRDETELPTSSNLSGDIRAALNESRFLIVVCSKTTKDSRWCMEEIEYFKELHHGNNANIITIVADGNPEDVFPSLLCNELVPVTDENGNVSYQNRVIEPLAANVAGKSLKESFKKLGTEFLRVAAPLLGCGYDDLYNRESKKKIRRIFTFGSVVMTFLLLFGLYNSAMLWEINNQKIALAAANVDLQKKTDELNQSNLDLQQSNYELEKKTKEAEDNLVEANKQRKIAEANLAEAERQRKAAEENLAEAERQKKIAEENMRIAQENEAAANEANRNLRAKNAEILATQAQLYLGENNVTAAVETALESISLSKENNSTNAEAEEALINASGAYHYGARQLTKTVKLSAYVNFIKFSSDGKRILAADTNGDIYLIDYKSGSIVKTYTLLEIFGSTGSSSYCCVNGNTGYVYCRNQLISIDLDSGNINWHFNKNEERKEYFYELVNNPESEYIVLTSSRYPVAISKATGEVATAFENIESVGSYYSTNFQYLSADEKIYLELYTEKCILIYNIKNNTLEDVLSLPEGSSVLSMGENDNQIFLNLKLGSEDNSYDSCCLICLNKKDNTVKWSSHYAMKYASKTNYNNIFEFSHRLPDKDKVYHDVTSVVVVSGINILAFDINDGRIYFNYEDDTNEKFLYCEPNERNTLKIADATKMSLDGILLSVNAGLTTEDAIYLSSVNCDFEEERKYIEYADDKRFAVASKDSADIDLYYEFSDWNYKNIAESDTSINGAFADNSAGILAMCSYKNGHYSIRVYDVNSEKQLGEKSVETEITKICFVDTDTIIATDSKGYVIAMKTDGTLIAEGDLQTLIREKAELPEYEYIGTYYACLIPSKDGFFYGVDNGIFEIKVADNAFSIGRMFVNNEDLKDFFSTEKNVSFISEDYRTNLCKIGVMSVGDYEASYVKDKGEIALFKRDSVTSVAHNEKYGITFTSKEGYIGLYKYGADDISKIIISHGETAPTKVLFTPDAKHVIAMFSNGTLVKYSTETLERLGEYSVPVVVWEDTSLSFIDEFTFEVRNKTYHGDSILIDSREMKLKAQIKNILHIMKKDKKIIFREYTDTSTVIGYYNYLVEDELIEYAKEFLGNAQ